MKSVTQVMAEFICDLSFDKIPNEVVDNMKKCVLDAIGNTMGGLNAFETKAIRSAVLTYDESPSATIWGIGKKVSVADAAFVNAVAHEGQDFTAAGADAGIETNTVPATVAVAEKEKVDGKALITALIAGFETQWRVAMALDSKGPAFKQKGFYISGTSGPLGPAAACSKILNLDKNQTTMALSIAASQALGIYYPFYEGVRAKVLYSARAGQTGVMAAYMAREGLTGALKIMEADKGFLGCFADLSNIDMATWKLGEEFLSKYLCYKLYPCCRYIHPYLDAALKIRREHSVKPEDIEKMMAYGPPEEWTSLLIRPWPPKDAMDAQFHLFWTVAAALINGEVTVDTYEEKMLKDPKIWELAQKVEYIEDPKVKARFKYTALPPFTVPGDLTIRLKNGKEYTEKVDQPRGVATPTYEDIYEKFENQAKKVLANDRLKKIAETCKNLEKLEDVGDLVKLTVP